MAATMLPPPAPSVQPLPREIIKWLQSLDLSFAVKNPKRDFANGYLTAEILSRYYLKDINMNNFENGTRLAAKVDNWEQIYKFCKKKGSKDGVQISKNLIDPVIHCATGAAEALCLHLYSMLTKRPPPQPFDSSAAQAQAQITVPAFMRDTASRRLKDPEIDRIQDKYFRSIVAVETLSSYHLERREQKAQEAPMLISKERKVKLGVMEEDLAYPSKDDSMESEQVAEVTVKAMTGAPNQPLNKKEPAEATRPTPSGRSGLVEAIDPSKNSSGALATIQQHSLFVKPAADIMRPLIASIAQESEELGAVLDPKKDLVASFLEQCQREVVPEEVSVRVFETLANRAQLLVDTLTKSPPEFWKLWATFFPALATFPESSPVFGGLVKFFKRLGDHMRESDPVLTQQLIADVGLPSLAKELVRSPEKRELLCDIVYSYAQEDTLSHLLVLRALKEKLGSEVPVYVACLSHFVSLDAHLSLLDEHLLDLYIYYALVGMQSPRPQVRVAGLSILCAITTCSAQHGGMLKLLPSFELLAGDEWWEVQAQLLLLCAGLLNRIAVASRHGGPDAEGAEEPASAEEVDCLMAVVSRLFLTSGSKNVLQVGLTALVHVLQDYPTLLPVYVSVLLEQPANLRQRLLRLPGDGGEGGEPGVVTVTYVMGSSSRMYDEACISAAWPHLEVAKTLARQLEASPEPRFELEHAQVLLASLPPEFEEPDAEEWLEVFEKVKQYVFAAVVDQDLHPLSAQIVGRFWLSSAERVSAGSTVASRGALLQALQLLYAEPGGAAGEASVVQFLKGMVGGGGAIAGEVAGVLESFRETCPAEYERSRLRELLP